MLALMPWTRRRNELLPRAGRLIPEDFETLWNRLVGLPVSELEPTDRWIMTTEERENEVVVRAELPGFAPEEVRVEMVGDMLTIEAEHRPPEGAAPTTEREYARVRREMTVAPGINLEAVTATYRNGVLEVHLPRTPEATPRRIEVKG